MDIKNICEKAEDLAKKYNPDRVSPFPFDKITNDEKDLSIYYVNLPDHISGAIVYNSEKKNYLIYINNNKPENRRHFTTAHEVGHYFLHKEIIKKEETIIDDGDNAGGNPVLYRLDDYLSTKIEKEANNFAASLIMPSELVRDAWDALGDVEECAKIFNVSISAMSIRLERLNLIN